MFLAVELDKADRPSGQIALEALQRSLVWANIQEYRVLAAIPVDKRHNAKVDYPALSKTLEINP
jgi:olefin beta-lactone synthetase